MQLWFPVLFCNIHRGCPGWREGPTPAPRSASHCSGWSFSRCLHLCLLCALDVLAVPAAALAHSHTAVTAPPFPRAFLFFSIDMSFFCLFCFFLLLSERSAHRVGAKKYFSSYFVTCGNNALFHSFPPFQRSPFRMLQT